MAETSSCERLASRYQRHQHDHQPERAPTVKAWAAAESEDRLFLSILTLGEYDKGIHNVPDNHPDRPRFIAARDRLAYRFAARILSVGDAVVRRWGVISGMTKRATGHSPPVIDTLFAATALEHDLYLVTRNVRDVRASGAQIFDPWTGPCELPLEPDAATLQLSGGSGDAIRPR